MFIENNPSTQEIHPFLESFTPAETSMKERISTTAFHYLSWPITLIAYPLHHIIRPIVQSLYNDVSVATEEIEYSKYQTSSLQQEPPQHLNHPMTLSNKVKLTNRIVKAGITDGLCTIEGNPTAEMIHIYERYAAGGYGMIISPDTTVDRRCRLPGVTGHTPIVDEESDPIAFSALANAMKKNGPAILQITHPGPVVPYSDSAFAPSSILANNGRSGLPKCAHGLSDAEIDSIFSMFLTSARQAEKFGFNGVQLVAAAGYLPALFLNKFVNNREGKWANQTFILSLIEALLKQRKNQEFVIGLKINSEDLYRGGFNSTEAAQLIETISKLNVDFIEIGGGNCEALVNDLENNSNETEEGHNRNKFFLEFAKPVLANTEIKSPIMATGEWRNVSLMDSAVKKYPNLLVGLGRPTCADPNIATKITQGEISQIPEWYKEYLPPLVKEELSKGTSDARKMAHGIEMGWYALSVASLAYGAAIPKVRNIFDKPENALALKVHMLIRAILPRSLLGDYFTKHPFSK